MSAVPDERPPNENAGRAPGVSQSSFTSDNTTAADSQGPEYRSSRRRFLIYAVMCGFAPPERLTDRIVADIEGTPP